MEESRADAPAKKYKSGPSGKRKTPRPPAPDMPGNPLQKLVRSCLDRNAERLIGPRTVVELARVASIAHGTLNMVLRGRRRLTDSVGTALAAALEVDLAAVEQAGAATWAMRPPDADHG